MAIVFFYYKLLKFITISTNLFTFYTIYDNIITINDVKMYKIKVKVKFILIYFDRIIYVYWVNIVIEGLRVVNMGRDVLRSLALFTQVSISMLVPVFICFFAGRAVDRLLGVKGIFLLIFTAAGILAGFRSVYMLVRGFFKDRDTYIDMNKIKNELMKKGEEDENDK